ncbi:MAG: DUF1254 domain-containing protein, partial [Cyclobacteriaceae bacterium]|nr:DUF1254 domain-containing protein [Cyclobacteriaceae bacterium]
MNYKLLVTGVFLSTLFSCQEAKKEDTAKKEEATVSVPTFSQTTDIPKGILTPNEVETSIGTLNFFDGTPTEETVQLVYDNLDRSRGIEAFLKGIQGASIRELIEGPKAIGANVKFNDIMIIELLNSKGIFLTGNTSTLYLAPVLDLKENGPMVVEAPPGLLGGFNSAWFEYITDIGVFGPDKGKGGKFLVLPPDYKGNIPSGYFVVKSPTFKTWGFMRLSIADGLEKAT